MSKKRKVQSIFIGLLLLLVLAVTAAAGGQESDRPARTRPPLAGQGAENNLRIDLDENKTGERHPAEITALLPWSQVVFQSYQDDNWEIYLADDAGNNQRRLTNHGAADLTPRLDRGGQRVVFVSDRDGDDEIYVMAADGSELRQLTNNAADDYRPAWSPDGSQIAFQSVRDGQAEIYVMQADGSGVRRLTNHEAYDGLASWSPDGEQIAFASTRSGDWRIWVMNADGSNPRQLSTQKFSENPVWSPDGSQIAYDADGNNDGWQELWVMAADGSNQRVLHTPSGDMVDAWASGWSPDGRFITFTRAEWVYYQGEWYWVGAYLYRAQLEGGYATLMIAGEGQSSLHWQTLDTSAPTSWLAPLPAYARGDVEVAWDGLDGGGAGIDHFDVQFRAGSDGNWTDWQMDIPPDEWASSAIFTHDPGQTVAFRVRAVDKAFNDEPWPAGSGETVVTFYNWAIDGHAFDNRGTPLPGVVASGGGNAFEIWPSDGDGTYRTYYAGYDFAFTPQWTKEGYLALPATSFEASSDRSLDVILPPAGNVVQEWGFESGQLPSSAWTAAGLYPPTGSDAFHTGSSAAFLGLPFALGNPTMLFSQTVRSEAPQLAISGNGDLHVLWLGGTTEESRIYYSRRPAGGDWETPAILTAGADEITYLAWAVTKTGRIHVVWSSYDGRNDTLHHMWRNEDGKWSTPFVIYGRTSIWPVRLVGDKDGNAHLVWQLPHVDSDAFFYARTDAAGNWSSPDRLGGDMELTVDDLDVGADGRVHLLWRYSGDDILYSYRRADGSWSERELVWPGGYNWHHRLLVTDEGVVHIIWENVSYGTLYHRQRSPGGRWTEAKVLDENAEVVDNNMALTADDQGTVHVVWPKGTFDGCSGLFYAAVDPAGKWTGPLPVSLGGRCASGIWLGPGEDGILAVTRDRSSSDSLCRVALAPGRVGNAHCVDYAFADNGLPDVAIDQDNFIHIVWHPFGGGVNYTESARVSNTGAALLSQAITVPTGAISPTLSFLYQLDGAREEGGYLEVSVTDAVTETNVYSTSTTTTGWTHQWLDLSPWSGRSVTVTLKVHEVAGAPRTSALIDEVTVAPAYPDSWVSLAAPAGAAAGGEIVLVIDYGNRGGVDLAGAALTLSLPEEITLAGATPAPTDGLAWDLGTLPAGASGQIVVTGTVAVEAELYNTLSAGVTLTGEMPELEVANNTDEISLRVGHFIFLPAIADEPD